MSAELPVTPLGWGGLVLGSAILGIGVSAHWISVAVLGAGLLALLAGSLVHVVRRPRLQMERAVEPPRVEKGRPAIAVIQVKNLSRRSLPPLLIEQRLGDRPVRARLPRLRRGEQGLRTYRLPTSDRGVYEVGPVEIPRADPFGLCRSVQRMGSPQPIRVHPRVLTLRSLPTGTSRNLEGPSSDMSPQGSVTFHRLREYVVGDDLRAVHWPSTARVGRLVVRHHVDTAQPFTVVLLDVEPARYSAATFEEAVDVAASACVSMAAGRAPVQLRTTSGDRVGGAAYRDPAVMVDFLTELQPSSSGSLESELMALRRDRGGTALIVVTGRLDMSNVPLVASVRKRFDRVVVASMVERPARVPISPGITVVESASAQELAGHWNGMVTR